MYFASQRFYRVEYEWNKVWKVAGTAVFLFIMYRLLHLPPLDVVGTLVKVFLVIAFGAALVFLKVIDSREIIEIKSIARRIFTRSSDSKSTEEHSRPQK
jgi:hypothetical protein